MKIRSLLLSCCVLFLWDCQREEEANVCPYPGDHAVDILAGPTLTSFGDSFWAFISNEYGGRGTTERVTTYPLFLDWVDGCQNEFAVNILTVSTNTFEPDFDVDQSSIVLTSYYDFPVGTITNLSPTMYRPALPRHTLIGKTITINNVPNHLYVEFSNGSYFANVYDATNQQLSVGIPERQNWRDGSFMYVTLWDLERSEFRGVLVDLVSAETNYDYAKQSRRMTWYVPTFEGKVGSVNLMEVFDEDGLNAVEFGSRQGSDGLERFLVPDNEGTYVMSIRYTEYPDEDIQYGDVYSSLPAKLSFPDFPIRHISHSDVYLNLEVENAGYLILDTDEEGFTIPHIGRRVIADLPAGKHQLRLAGLPPVFLDEYPTVDFSGDHFKGAFDLLYWHYPEAVSGAHREVSTLSWLDRQRFQYFRTEIHD